MKKELLISEAQPIYQASALLPLLEQEAIALFSRTLCLPVLHFWRHRHSLLLGSRDAALPFMEEAAQAFSENGIAVAVRPFGGLAVLLDPGVLNVSLILPQPPSLDDTFLLFAHWLQQSLRDFGEVVIGQVEGAYCNGRFDLAIEGLKFAGIAQRRIQDVAIVSAFVNVVDTDAFEKREPLVHAFYRQAGRMDPAFAHLIPPLRKGTVGNLYKEASLPVEQAVASVTEKLKQHAALLSNRAMPCPTLSSDYYRQALQRFMQRQQLKEWIAR
ncbi:lipoate--protein ligase family protein [Sulfoacidibacillus thermotolerans]|uniref:lipoate--protein ligase family protein n=1 Tax=Sulfoacidibacillus thermotolerans TaxID=1765684 RepID=UPI0015E7F38E|nr:lipoate--protein ligase family protein [Sulfoacidibacillus thermotolerans]